MRQIILDTETTGLEAASGHRIIEIGCIELINRRATQNRFHRYINPDRDIDEGAQAVHGISRAQLEKAPRFAEIAADLLSFLGDAELVIHNAVFDLAFLDAEFARLTSLAARFSADRKVVDSLLLARQLHPGQRNSLDALCKRYSVDNSRRELHGALLDAQLLAEVYLAMTGGQSALALFDSKTNGSGQDAGPSSVAAVERPPRLRVVAATGEELAAHEAFMLKLGKASGKTVNWPTGSTQP